jgi:putative hydrolase of the HAD superfamily
MVNPRETWPQPDLIFFDVGDTLMRADPSWTGVYLEVCHEFGIDTGNRELEAAFARALAEGSFEENGPFEATPEGSYRRVKEFDQRVMNMLGRPDVPDEFFRSLSRHFERRAAWHVFHDVHPALEAIGRAGIRRAVLSNWVWALPELLHEVELAHHFEAMIVSARVGYQKPQPEIFRHALDVTGVPPERAIHVGDTPDADVIGARSVGIRPVLIDRYNRHPGAAAEHPGVPIIRDLDGLLELIGLPAAVTP